jgi:ribose transport system ATP-binding protein
VGLLSENRKEEGLVLGMSIADNLTLSNLHPLGPFGFVFPSRRTLAAQRAAGEMDIRCRAVTQKVSDLSGGNQQKVALARLLHQDARVLLLDEPTRGIDVGSKAQIYACIDRWACQGKAILMVSSYLPELLGICDRLAVVCRGRAGPARPVSQWDEQSVMRAATGGVVEP